MIFFIMDTINETNKPIPLLARVEDAKGIAHCNFLEMLTSASLVQTLSHRGDIIYLDSVDNFDKVIPICNSDAETTENLTAVIKLLQGKINTDISLDVFAKIAATINKQKPALKLTATDLSRFFNAFKLYIGYKKDGTAKKIEYNSEFVLNKANTLPLIQEMNNKNSLGYLVGEKNKTLFMNSATDTVFIKLPAYDQLSTPEEIPVPNPNAYFRPYKNLNFFTMAYRDALSSDVDIHTITGNVDSNDLEIQENEKEFYTAMQELIEYGIKQRYPNNTLQECIEAGYDDPKVTSYLTQLALIVATWNWSHTGNYSMSFNFLDEDADSEVSEDMNDDGDETSGAKSYVKNPYMDDNKVTADAEYFLRDYINKAIRNKNVYAPAEAIIKLLRWGSRKPSRLKLKGVEEYLDLNNLRVENMSGSFKGLEVVKTGGATYELLGIIKASGKFRDTKYLQSLGYTANSLNIPVGVTAVKTYKGGIEQLVIFSIPTLIQYLENHEGDVAGIKIRGDKLNTSIVFDSEEVYSLESAVHMVSTSTSGERVFYRSDEMLDMYMEFNQLTGTTSELAVLQKYINDASAGDEIATKSFNNIADLMEKYAIENGIDISGIDTSTGKTFLNGMTGLREYFDATVANGILPVILDVASQNIAYRMEQKEATFEDYLNMYLLAMTKCNYSSRNKLKEVGETKSNSVAGKITSDLEKMGMFDQQGETEEEELMKAKTTLIMAIPDGQQFMELKGAPNESGEKPTLGYVAQVPVDGKTKFLLSTNVGSCPVSKVVNVNQIVKIALSDYYHTMMGQVERTSLRFTDEQSWATLGSLVLKNVK